MTTTPCSPEATGALLVILVIWACLVFSAYLYAILMMGGIN